MGIFNQLLSVIEWNETDEKEMFYRFPQDEIKKNSRLIIRPGQDAIFLNNGKIEGIFTEEGKYDIDTQIIPFLSTLKGFKYGLNSGLRAEVIFVNTKEFNEKWGTRQPINLQSPSLPGGMPIRANGSYQFKLSDYDTFIQKIAGVKKSYSTDDIKDRIGSLLDQLLMKHISTEGRDIFNIQAYAADISKGIQTDLDMELQKIGLAMTGFQINSVSYPEEVQKMQQKAAGQAMVGDISKYTQMAFADGMSNGNVPGGEMAGAAAGMAMGAALGQQMAAQMQQGAVQQPQQINPQAAQTASRQEVPNMQNMQQPGQGASNAPKFCPNCGTPVNGAKFCPNCGNKLV